MKANRQWLGGSMKEDFMVKALLDHLGQDEQLIDMLAQATMLDRRHSEILASILVNIAYSYSVAHRRPSINGMGAANVFPFRPKVSGW